MKPVTFIKNKDKRLEVEVSAIPDWEGFDKLIQFLQQEYSAIVLDSFDGIGSRKWTLKTNNYEYQLQHDDFFGNSICPLSPGSEVLVEQIGLDLEARLKNIE